MTRFALVLAYLVINFLATGLSAADKVDFAHDVVPLLRKQCGKCHTGARKEGGFSLNTRNTLIKGGDSGKDVIPTKADESPLIERITSNEVGFRMPPDGARMSPKEVGILRAWIDGGVVWEDGFAFEKNNYDPPLKPRRPPLPAAANPQENPIDRILRAATPEKRPVETISDAQFLRRVSLDLIGLLPTPEQLQAFQIDKSRNKREKLVDELLGNDLAFADHWLTFWNDLLRNDYTGTGFITGGRKQITTWLHRSLMENKPYDQMVRELVSPTAESEGYIQGIRWRGEVSAAQTNEVQFAQSISQSFLGINMKCASCHDSFIDRWKLSEAFGLAAIYASGPLPIYRCDKPTGETATAAWPFPELGQIDPKASQPDRLKQLAALMTHPENGRLSRTIVNRLWHQLFGEGIVHPVDAMNTEPRNSDLLDFLAVDLTDHGYNLKYTLKQMVLSRRYQERVATPSDDPNNHDHWFHPLARRMTAEQFVDAVWQLTQASPGKADAVVSRAKSPGREAPDSAALKAKWVWSNADASASAPGGEAITLRTTFELSQLPVRAACVVTCDNEYQVYVNGKKILADGNWEVAETASLQNELVVGANQITIVAKNGGADANPAGVIFEARLIYRELPTTTIATGTGWKWTKNLPDSNGRFAQEPVDWANEVPVKNPGVWGARLGDSLASSLAAALDENPVMVRASLVKSDVLMRVLGRPNRDQIVTSRPAVFTTLETLELANGDQLKGYLETGAKNLSQRFANRPAELVTWLYRFALSRDPTASEKREMERYLGSKPDPDSIEDLLWSVVMLKEFLYVR